MQIRIVAAAAVLASSFVGGGMASAQGYGPPPGSYAATCRRISMDGPYLTAICRDRYGDYRETRIDANRCRTFANLNGRLACGR
jgi:hypothetical protein